MKKTYSIRSVILTLMISEVLVAILVTGFLWYSNGKSAVDTLSKQLSSEIELRIEERILTVLESAKSHSANQANVFSSQLIPLGSENQRELTYSYQKGVLKRNSHITTLFTCSPDGELFGIQRSDSGQYLKLQSTPGKPGLTETSPDGKVSFIANFDATVRPWFTEAMAKKKSGWTPVYRFSGIPQLGITHFEVNTDKDGVSLISACDLTLGPLNQFLSELDTTEHGQIALLDPKGILVASSALDSFKRLKSKSGEEASYRRVRGIESPTPIIREAVQHLTQIHSESPSTWPTSGTVEMSSEAGDIFLSWLMVELDEDQKWISLLAVPRSDLTMEVSERTRFTAIAFLILIVITAPLVWRTAEGITRPVMELNKGMDQIAQFKIEESDREHPPRPSRLRELNEMQSRMELMRHALTSFEKYVPSRVVRKLVTEDKIAVPGMEEAKACIFFSDIIGFTEVAESLDPDQLVQLGGEYLEGMSQQIHRQSGILDKFIGDAVMAFWIAEVDGRRVTSKACHAALQSQHRLKELRADWRQRNLPALRARIGLHTGPVRVGNIGSSTRLNYTILGDSVNLASRLEGLNKVYGTSIITSEEVHRIAAEDFHFRILDRVAVKGRRQGGTIYELVCPVGEASKEQIELAQMHEAALEEYFQGNFDQALNSFNSIRSLAPEDAPSQILVSRCEELIAHPPTEWAGVISIDRNIRDNG